MLTILAVQPFRGKAKVYQVKINILENVLGLFIWFWNLLLVADKNVVKLQVIVNQTTIMN